MKIGPLEIKLFEEKSVKKDEETGATGTTIYGGYLDDDEYVAKLTGSQAFRIYNRMRRSDAVVGAVLLACELPVRATEWYVRPATEDKKDKEVADFVSACLFEKMSITWDDFLRQALLMLPYGVMLFEKVFTMDTFENKDMVALKKFAPRMPDTVLKWETDGGEDGITQQTIEKGTVSIPIEKLLIFTHRKEGDNWRGISVLRQAYRPWFLKSHIEKINAIAIEKQGLGIPYVELPKGYTDKDKTQAKEVLKNIRAHKQSYLIYPQHWEVGFKDMKANTTRDPKETIDRYNREIFTSVLAQFMELGSRGSGSYALSKEQSKTFHNNLTAIARQVRNVVNKYAVKQLVDLNYSVEEYPTLEFADIGETDIEKLSKSVYWLASKGVITPDEKLEEHIRSVLDLPEPPEEEEVEDKPDEPDEPEDKLEASEFSVNRKLTFAEKKVNFADLQVKMDKAEEKLKEMADKVMKKNKSDLMSQLQDVLTSTNSARRMEKLKKLSLRYAGEYEQEIRETAKKMFEYGKMMAAHEMKKSVPPTTNKMRAIIEQKAGAVRDIMESGLTEVGKMSVSSSIAQSKGVKEAMQDLSKRLDREISKIVNNAPTITVSGSVNQGRRATFQIYKDDIYALQRSEVLDGKTCNFCLSVDKRVYSKNDSFTRVDQIHSNCRGIWVEVLKTETPKPKVGGMPDSLRNRFESINVFEQPRNPITKKDSPAEREADKRE